MKESYTDVNARTIDEWVEHGWQWGVPIDRACYAKAMQGVWEMLLTPNRPVPKAWFPPLRGARVLGLASGGGQQMPIFAALGAVCSVLDYSLRQIAAERMVAEREGYPIELIRADMTQPLPFADNTFDLIFHPVSNCYIRQVQPVWEECARVLKPGGILMAGLDNGLNFAFDEDENPDAFSRALPFDPLADEALLRKSLENGWGVQFSHTIEEQIDGQLRAGLCLTHVYGDTNESGALARLNIPAFWATRAVKP